MADMTLPPASQLGPGARNHGALNSRLAELDTSRSVLNQGREHDVAQGSALMRTKTTLLAVVLLATGAATSALAGPSDELRRTAIAQVAVAGSVAGLARACGVEPTPITAAIRQMFNRLQLDGTT